jgi:hypothetical protein
VLLACAALSHHRGLSGGTVEACRRRSSWTMADRLTFLETCALFLLHDLPWAD